MTPAHLTALTSMLTDAYEAGAGAEYRRTLTEAIAAGRVELAARKFAARSEVTGSRWALGTCAYCSQETATNPVDVDDTVCPPCRRELGQ